MKKQLAVITGMHRSGTSALAKVLVDMGFDAGTNLMPPDADNQLGYWEDYDIFNLNNKILSKLFLSWHNIEDIDKRRVHFFWDEIEKLFLDNALEIIERKFARSSQILIKDPRFSILWPFWEKVFTQMDAELIHFHIYRYPLSVARSLEKRNGFSIEKGLLLWYYYNMAFLGDQDKTTKFVSYHHLLTNPAEACKTISKIVGLEYSPGIGELSLDAQLDHFQEIEKIPDQLYFPDKMKELWELLKKLSQDNESILVPELDENLFIRGIANQSKPVLNSNITATLIVEPEKDSDSGKIILTNKSNINQPIKFEVLNQHHPVDEFRIYLNDEPCKIILKNISVETGQGVVLVKPTSGNYEIVDKDKYYFSDNSPCLIFKLDEKQTIKSVELQPIISILTDDEVLLLISKLNIQNADLSKQHEIDHFYNKIVKDQIIDFQKRIAGHHSEIENFRSTLALSKQQNEQALAGQKQELENTRNLLRILKQQNEQALAGYQDEIESKQKEFKLLKQQNEIALAGQQELFNQQRLEIVALEKKSLWLYTEFNKAKASLSWKITRPLRKFQAAKHSIENKTFILKNDIGASYRLLLREGGRSFMSRLIWYAKGKRLKEEIEWVKSGATESIQKEIKKSYLPKTLLLPEFAKPVVSIVIPMFNNIQLTANCVHSLVQNTDGVEYEVIIVDDHSTNKGYDLKKMFVGARIIYNENNIGFLKSCNMAAKLARGKYIVFLNNDTEPQPGWLKPLFDLVENDGQIAIAGPRLLYPDGRLQEAGGIIWNDASGWNFGKYDDPEKSEYNYLKEVDYISGACMLVRKNVWDGLNGFDENFAPAYYEDTDLAFGVRKLGYKVMYQPLSKVTHFEGASNGCDESTGLKKFQTINQRKFLDKWQHELSIESSPNGTNVFFHRDRSLNQKHLLVIDHYVPMYDKDAGSRSTFSYLKLFLKMGYKIHFIGDNFFKHEPYTTVLQQMGIEVLYGSFYQQNIRDWFRKNGQYINFVIAHRVHIAPKYFEMIRKFTTAKIAYIGHDLQYLGSRRKFELTGNKKFKKESEKFERIENKIFNTVDFILPFSTYEAPFIKAMASGKTVKTIPVYFFNDIPEKVPGFEERKDILFVGYFGHPPNPDAILWFVEDVFPVLKKHLPEVRLNIVGSKPTPEVLALANDSITVTGFVADSKLLEYYQKSKIAILPLRFGAGVKGKLLESLYHQIPTVITPVAAEGIPEIENYSLIADEADAFAQAIHKIYTNKNIWNQYSENGKQLIKKYYTEDAARQIMVEIFEE